MLLVAQLDPRDDPCECRVPAFASGDVRRLAEPEVPANQFLESLGAEEHGRHLPRFLSIIATRAEMFVSLEMFGDVVSLKVERLLCAEQIGIECSDRLDKKLAPLRPVVLAVVRRAIADVEAHHAEFGIRRGSRSGSADERTTQ